MDKAAWLKLAEDWQRLAESRSTAPGEKKSNLGGPPPEGKGCLK